MKDLDFAEYLTEYGELLTERQKNIIEGYYLYDLSYAELAENYGGSRQSMFDAVKKARNNLLEFEKALKLVEMKKRLTELATELDKTDKVTSEKILKIIKGE